MIIKLMRHALSSANISEEATKDTPDHEIHIVESGIPKALETGKNIGAEFLTEAMIFRSPYKRTRQTTVQVLIGAGLIKTAEDELPVRIFEDPRLREVEHGYGGQASVDAQKILRDKVGYFWYQLERGESPVQAYDRVSGFLESFMRQMERKKKDSALIVSHGLTIRVFVMRFFHLTVEQFDTMRNPHNCDVITIAPKETVANPQFTSGRWAVTGLRLRDPAEVKSTQERILTVSEPENTPLTTEERHAKIGWCNGMMNGDNAGLIRALLDTLPSTNSVDANGTKQLDRARDYMAELWTRGVSKNEFFAETGLTGAPVDVLLEGISKQQTIGEPVYFKLFLSEKDAAVCAAGLKSLLLGRLSKAGDWAGQYRLLFFVDIDTESKEYPSPYHAGLTPHAVCFDVNMADVEECFAAIDKAAKTLVPEAARNVRIGIGQFGPDEYLGMRDGYLYTKRMVFNMGSEWLLVKNIARRAGRFGWFWRFVARRYERFDNP